MKELLIDSFKDALFDTVKLIPFLLITYVVMEWLERKTAGRQAHVLGKAEKLGPLIGGRPGRCTVRTLPLPSCSARGKRLRLTTVRPNTVKAREVSLNTVNNPRMASKVRMVSSIRMASNPQRERHICTRPCPRGHPHRGQARSGPSYWD